VAAGVDLGHAHHVLDDMASMVRHGARFAVGASGVPVPHATVTIGAVHSVHITGGLVNMWHAQYAHRPDPPELAVIQVLFDQLGHQPRLDQAHTTFDVQRHVRFPRRRS
jgi:hypothetical protein